MTMLVAGQVWLNLNDVRQHSDEACSLPDKQNFHHWTIAAMKAAGPLTSVNRSEVLYFGADDKSWLIRYLDDLSIKMLHALPAAGNSH